ncbi:MAG: hypothetical protein JWQ97_1282 [Phenylobacterium sp.]|nr:hypothetical protein [Phenylobacterium sp.]
MITSGGGEPAVATKPEKALASRSAGRARPAATSSAKRRAAATMSAWPP